MRARTTSSSWVFLAAAAAAAATGCGGGSSGGGGAPAMPAAATGTKSGGTSTGDTPAAPTSKPPTSAPSQQPAGGQKSQPSPAKPSPAKPSSGGGASGGPRGPSGRLGMGVNLSPVTFYASEWPFVDVFKTSQTGRHGEFPWTLVNPQKQPAPPLDADGYPQGLRPGQSVTTICARTNAPYPAGAYTLRFRGDGEVQVSGDAQTTSLNHDGQGVAEVQVPITPTGKGIIVRVLRSAAGNHVRDVQLIMPGFAQRAASEPFHPKFLDSLRPFGVLRFMDWGEANFSPLRRWADRKRPTSRTQFRDGVAFEYMVQLSNTLKKDPWLCVPHQADDDFVRRMAQLVKSQLDPSLRVYVELSNEVWNASFSQHHYAREQGSRQGVPWHTWYARRSAQVFRIWEEVFGRQRLVRVVAGHGQNVWLNQRILEALPSPDAADALAIAPYFGGILGKPDAWQRSLGLGINGVIEACRQDIRGRVREMVRANVAAAAAKGLPLIAYEGGQHLVGVGGAALNDGRLTALFNGANRDPRMGDLYREYFTMWEAEGGGLFVAFNSCYQPNKYGSWGLREHQQQDAAPKYQATRAFAERWRRPNP